MESTTSGEESIDEKLERLSVDGGSSDDESTVSSCLSFLNPTEATCRAAQGSFVVFDEKGRGKRLASELSDMSDSDDDLSLPRILQLKPLGTDAATACLEENREIMGRRSERASSNDSIAPQSLLPGLPNDVALLCLARVSYSYRRQMSQVCRIWRQVARSETLYSLRVSHGLVEDVLCVCFLDQGVGAGMACEDQIGSQSNMSGRYQDNLNPRTTVSQLRASLVARSALSPPQEPPQRGGGIHGGMGPQWKSKDGDDKGPGLSIRFKAIACEDLVKDGGPAAFPGGCTRLDWFNLPPLHLGHSSPSDLWDLQIVTVGTKMYVLGGTTRILGTSMIDDVRKDVWVYDGITGRWNKEAVLGERGKKLVAAGDSKNQRLFLASSDEPHVSMAPVQMTSLKCMGGMWEGLPPLPPIGKRRYLHGAACRGSQFYIFMINPDTGNQWAEFYDPLKKEWETIDGMATRKFVAVVGSDFYSLENGPIDHLQGRHVGVERFDWSTRVWKREGQLAMADKRRARTKTSVTDTFLVGLPGRSDEGGKLFVIGSWQQQSLSQQKWEQKASVIVVPIGAAGVGGGESGTREGNSRVVGEPKFVRIRAGGRACIGGSYLTL